MWSGLSLLYVLEADASCLSKCQGTCKKSFYSGSIFFDVSRNFGEGGVFLINLISYQDDKILYARYED